MHQILINVIANRQCLSVHYDGGQRIIEPHCYGRGKKGDLLRAYQVSGQSKSGNSEGWKLFSVEKMREASILSETFSIRNGYKPNDSAMPLGVIAHV